MTTYEFGTPFDPDSEAVRAAETLSEQPSVPISGDYLRAQADFVGKMATFFEGLYQHSTPDRIQYDFHFPGSILSEVSYPELLKDRLMTRDLVSVKLSVTRNHGELATTSFEFIDEDGRLYASRDPELFNSSEPDRVINNSGDDAPIGRFSDADLDTTRKEILGLGISIEPDDSDPSPNPGIVAVEWIAELQKRASLADISAEYTLPSKRAVKYSAKEVDGKLQIETGSIRYETGLPGRHIKMELDISNGLSLKFYTLENGEKTRLTPDTGDLMRLTEIIEIEQELISGTAIVNVINVATLSEDAIRRVQENRRDNDR